jgi:L-ascorbate metabolism protein UlaG (beta-lactamase superfamily)
MYRFVPLGTQAWFHSVGISRNVSEMNWWDYQQFKNVGVVCLPTNHWSDLAITSSYIPGANEPRLVRLLFLYKRRDSKDQNQRLCASWGVIGKKRRFFFAGSKLEYHLHISIIAHRFLFCIGCRS